MTIKSFKNKESELIANGGKSKRTVKLLPAELHYTAYKKMLFLDNAPSLEDVKAWKSLRLEKLERDRRGQWSIRINDKYRICFKWDGKDAFDVEVIDYH